MDWEKRVYLVTGASSGMGESCCKALLEKKAYVIGIDLQEASICHERYHHSVISVLDEEGVKSCLEEIQKTYGRLDGLVNCAGVFAGGKKFYDLSLEEWNRVLSVNATGTFIAARAAAPLMIRRKKGKIVNISCIRSGIFRDRMADYAASKGAVASLTGAMALDLAPYNIQVNSVTPGFIYTGMTSAAFDRPEVRTSSEALIPAGRIGMPEDVAGVILFLLSDASDYITGSVLYADGGYHIQK